MHPTLSRLKKIYNLGESLQAQDLDLLKQYDQDKWAVENQLKAETSELEGKREETRQQALEECEQKIQSLQQEHDSQLKALKTKTQKQL